ncbi:MAG: G-D-S-L family lipolytic protein [Flavobacterium sp.]|nr:G-D-S-L family lipolytic protein [Flavobacterium sp.]
MIKNFKWLLLVSLTFAACTKEDATPVEAPVSPGSAIFTKYVSLGNSLTAGYSDGALFKRGQEGSYPNLLAQQFAQVGGGAFTIPFCGDDNLGGLLLGGTPIQGTRLYFNGAAPVSVPGTPLTEITNQLTGPFNNMGVPGAKSYHLLAQGYGNLAVVSIGQANPYYARFATSPTSSIIEDAVVQNPTFFSLWIGNNDVLLYATSGGTGVNQKDNLDPTTYGNNDITSPTVFASAYNELVNAMTANGAKGVVANIPYVTTIPYFTTVPYNPVPLDAATAALLNANYAPYNGGLVSAFNAGMITEEEKAKRTITFHEGLDNSVVMVDSYLTNLAALSLPSYRQATASDLMVLPAQNFIGALVNDNPQQVNGVSVPLADNWVLSKDEIAEIKVAVDAYNASIKSIAEAKGLAFVDANAVMSQVFNGGIRFGNYHLSASYVAGGAFSLDGVHPSARGAALIANKFMEAINAKYGSTFKALDLAKYPIQFPKVIN